MGKPDPDTFAIETLQRKEEEQLDIADACARKIYATRVLKALKKLKVTRINESVAEQLLSGEISIQDLLVGKHESGKWEGVIENACREYQDLYDIAFLLFYAPMPYNDEVSLELDSQARKIQLDHFYRIFDRIKGKRMFVKETQAVTTYRNLKAWLKDFMERYGSRSKRVMVVFNGHGTSSGELRFNDNSTDVSTNVFLDDIHRTWEKMSTDKTMKCSDMATKFPETIKVVPAQCYGHIHQQREEQKKIVQVACLTNSMNPTTQYVYKFNTMRNQVRDSMHVDLINFARSESQENAQQTTANSANNTQQVTSEQGAIASNDLPEMNPHHQPAERMEYVDFTPLACMAFNGERAESGSSASWLDDIKTFQFHVTPKRLSEFLETSNTSAARVILAPLQMLGCQGATGYTPSIDKKDSKVKPPSTASAQRLVAGMAFPLTHGGGNPKRSEKSKQKVQKGGALSELTKSVVAFHIGGIDDKSK